MTDKELYELCKEYGANARMWKNRFIALLPEVYKRHLYKKRGYGSIFEFAAKLGGVSKNVVEDVLNLDKKLENKPALKELIPEIGLHKVRVVANIAKQSDQEEWAKKIKIMSKPALETYIREIRNSDPGIGIPIPPQDQFFSNDFETFTAKLSPKTIQKLKIIKVKMGQGTTWEEVFSRLVGLATPAPKRKIKQRSNKSRAVPAKQKRELPKICEIPGCNKPAEEIHHAKPWAIFKKHEELRALCKGHHELAHQSESIIDKKYRIYKIADSYG
jgi:hypothetical protein